MRAAFLSCEARLLMSASALWRQDSGLAGKAVGLSMQQVHPNLWLQQICLAGVKC